MMEELMASRFQTFFQGQKKASATSKEAKQSLYPICSAAQLLDHPSRKKIIQNMRLTIHESSEHFNKLYQALLNNFSEFTQLLPHPTLNAYQYNGGILNYALERTLVALEIRKNYKLPNEAQPATLADQERLWTYALFSGVLLYQISTQISYYRVHLFNAQKQFMQQWQPYTQSMVHLGSFYKYWLISNADAQQYRTTSTLLAKQIMPLEGFTWIASNPQVFTMWLALLNGDAEGAAGLHIIHDQADKKLLFDEARHEEHVREEALLDEELAKKEADEHAAFEKALLAEAETLDAQNDTAIGELFLNWLIKGIKNKSLRVNEKRSLVHMLEEGVFLLDPEIFKKFTYVYKQYPNWIVVQKQFNMLGFAKLSGHDYRFDQFFAKSADSTDVVSGILIEDPRGLFMGGKKPGLSEHLKATTYDLRSVYSKISPEAAIAPPIKPQPK